VEADADSPEDVEPTSEVSDLALTDEDDEYGPDTAPK